MIRFWSLNQSPNNSRDRLSSSPSPLILPIASPHPHLPYHPHLPLSPSSPSSPSCKSHHPKNPDTDINSDRCHKQDVMIVTNIRSKTYKECEVLLEAYFNRLIDCKITTSIKWEGLTMVSSVLFAASLTTAYDQLTAFAGSEGFSASFAEAFGSQYDPVVAQSLRSQWQSGDFSQLPTIQVVSSEILGTANGAYASSNNTIYLSEQFLATASQGSLVNALLEEIGHFVDAQVNSVDSPGDEGAIFAALVQGDSLSVSTLQALKAEDDHGTITVKGEVISVEQQNFTGTNGNNNITGTSANDTISPLLGQDTVDGLAGTDLLILNYSSNNFSGITSSPLVSNGTGGFQGKYEAYNGVSFDSVIVNNIELFQLTGTGANDTIYTINGNDTINGGGGSDFIDSGAGNDTVNGGDGNDNLYGGLGNDSLNGGLGDDYFDATQGNDTVNGGDGIDKIAYDFSSNISGLKIDLTLGTSIAPVGSVYTGIEAFALTTGSGNDSIKGGNFGDTFNTGAGNDTIISVSGEDNVDGGAGNDLLIVDYSTNNFSGIASSPLTSNGTGGFLGSYVAYNGVSFDAVNTNNIELFQITGTGANDTVYTGDGNDTINGGGGSDFIDSGAGNDTVNGDLGNDTLYGGLGNDSLNGGLGDDYLDATQGSDTVNGGDGIDKIAYNFSSSTGGLKIDLTLGTSIAPVGSVYTSIEAFALTTGSGNDSIKGGNFGDTFNTGAGNDSVLGGLGNDRINTGDGNDTIIAGLGDDVVDGQTGSDLLIVDYSGKNYTGIGGSTISISSTGGFNGSYFAQNIVGYDAISFNNIELVQITGTGVNDTIYTGGGNDTINGGTGLDTLVGGLGNDILRCRYHN